MENEKDLDFDTAPAKKEEASNESSSRARNRTVMLTPEMTSQVRSRLAQELEGSYPSGLQSRQPPAEMVTSGGFYTPTPASSRQQREAPAPAFQNGPSRHEEMPVANEPQGDGVIWVKESPVIGFLVGYDLNPNGNVYELRSGRLMVTSQATPGESSLLITDSSVSPMHAILRITQSGEIQVLDQLSEFGTKIKRFGSEEEESLSGEKSTLEHGDVVTFGNRSFHVCIIPRGNQR